MNGRRGRTGTPVGGNRIRARRRGRNRRRRTPEGVLVSDDQRAVVSDPRERPHRDRRGPRTIGHGPLELVRLGGRVGLRGPPGETADGRDQPGREPAGPRPRTLIVRATRPRPIHLHSVAAPLESRAPAFDACRLGPRGVGSAMRRRRRGRVAAAWGLRVPESTSPTSSSSCRIVAGPHAEAASMVAAFGVDPGASPENAAEVVRKSCDTDPGAPSTHRGGCPIRKTCATCGGAGVVCESGSRRGAPTRPPASPRGRRRVRAVPRRHGAVARSSQRRPAWRWCASTAHGPRRRPGRRRKGG